MTSFFSIIKNERILRFILLGLGLLSIYGRYDWAQPFTPYSLRSYCFSCYFFVFVCIATYLFSKEVANNARLPLILTTCVGIIFSLPYRILNLKTYSFDLTSSFYTPWNSPNLAPPHTNWFPEAFFNTHSIPHEAFFFLGITFTGIGAITFYFRRNLFSKSNLKVNWSIAVGLFTLIVVETWLHLSLRSPYTYISNFERPASENFWYFHYMFPNLTGAVNRDYGLYRNMEELFLGSPQDIGLFISRLLPIYITSQFSYFFNPYYVWIVLNVSTWSLGVVAIYYICKKYFDHETGVFASFLFASAQGEILYVAQPVIYSAAIAGVVIMLALQNFYFSRDPISKTSVLSFGVIFGLFMFIYDNQPWLPVLFFTALIWKFDLKKTLIGIITGFTIYIGLFILTKHLKHFHSISASWTGDPIANLLHVLRESSGPKLLSLMQSTVVGIVENSFHVFNICLMPALMGLVIVKGTRRRLFLLALTFPALATFSLLEMGQSNYSLYCRLLYPAYPSIYISCAVFLVYVSRRIRPAIAPYAGRFLAWSAIIAHLIHSNLDVWGHADIYFNWFYRGWTFYGPH